MKQTFEPTDGRGYVDVQESNPSQDERFSLRASNVGFSAQDLIDFGKWISKIGRAAIKVEAPTAPPKNSPEAPR